MNSLDLKINDVQINAILPTSPSPLDTSCLVTSQESDLTTEVDDGASSMNTNCSSTSERDQDMDDLDEEVSLAIAKETSTIIEVDEPLLTEFDVDSLCAPGKTLLWDLIQDPQFV